MRRSSGVIARPSEPSSNAFLGSRQLRPRDPLGSFSSNHRCDGRPLKLSLGTTRVLVDAVMQDLCHQQYEPSNKNPKGPSTHISDT